MGRRMVWVAVGVVAIVGGSLGAAGLTAGDALKHAPTTGAGAAGDIVGPKSPTPQIEEGELVVKDFQVWDGEAMAELRLHFRAVGKPGRDSRGAGEPHV